jgi:Replication-relaxation
LAKRLPRHKRAEPTQRPPFRLTERGCRILKAVNDCVVLRTDQVQILEFNSPSPTYERLEKLYHYEYLDRHFITQVAAAPAASKIVYSITPLSASVLAATFGYTVTEINYPGRAVSNWKTLQPILAVNDFRVHLMRAVRQLDGFKLVRWIPEKIFRAHPDFVYIKDAKGKTKKSPVYPDGYIILKTPLGETRFFVEIDSGTEGLEQFRSQIKIYQEYMLSGQYQERFKSDVLRVVIVTNSEKRLRDLRKAIAQVGGGTRYWLTTTGQATWPQLLSAPIWSKVTDETLYPFIG